MKILIITLSFFTLLTAKNVFSQDLEVKRWAALYDAAQKPLFITKDGKTGDYIQLFSEWLRNNIRYPIMAVENLIEGAVHVMYIIEKDGSIAEIEILNDPDPFLNREVVRVFQNAPRAVSGRKGWNSELLLYKPTRVLMEAKVHFVLLPHYTRSRDNFTEIVSDDVDINVTVTQILLRPTTGRPMGGTPTTIEGEELTIRQTFWRRITRIFR